MTPKKTRSSALLSALPPTLTLPALHAPPMRPRTKRIVQLRGPVLLLSKPGSNPNPTDDRMLILSADSHPAPVGATALSLQGHKFWFETPAARDAFLAVTRSAVRQATIAAHRYVKLREIGYGSTSSVYLVRRDDGLLFAMKAIEKVDVFENDSLRAGVVSERLALAEAAERNSPFIVRLVDAFETDTQLCFVTELAEFGDMQQVIDKLPGRRVSEQVAKMLFADAVAALEETHRMGFLYRDIKLANLLLTKSGRLRLADFGLATRLEVEYEGTSLTSETGSEISAVDEEPFRLTGRAKSFVGTRRYMSPEHLRGRGGYGAKADVWALGVALYVMLTGEFPVGHGVPARNTAELFWAISNEEIEYPSYLSEDVVELLKGMLQRDEGRRMGLKQVKDGCWLKDLDWAQMRLDASNDVPRHEVLRLVDGCKDVIREMEGDGEESCGEYEERRRSSTTSEECPILKRRKGAIGLQEMLGFAYRQRKEDIFVVGKITGDFSCSSCSSLSM